MNQVWTIPMYDNVPFNAEKSMVAYFISRDANVFRSTTKANVQFTVIPINYRQSLVKIRVYLYRRVGNNKLPGLCVMT